MIASLQPTAATRQVARQILYPKGIPVWLRLLFPQARLVTAGLLPASVRGEFGLDWDDRLQRRYDRWMRWAVSVYPRLPRSWRTRPKEQYLRRLRAQARAEQRRSADAR
jgi:uncharacterized protein (DUF2236 family)